MVVYISLPITGKCELKQRRIAKRWQKYFHSRGHFAINPFDIADFLNSIHKLSSREKPTYEQYMEADIENLNFCSHIFLCDGWQNSKGCITEVEKSIESGAKFLFERTYRLE